MRMLPPLMLLILAGCAGLGTRTDPQAGEGPVDVVFLGPMDDVQRPAPRPGSPLAQRPPQGAGPLRPQGRSADALDTTSASERAAATAASGEGHLLGETLAALGPPAEGGFWLRTGLVSTIREGRVITTQGNEVSVELRPSGREAGAGSQISLAALRALGLPLTQLAPLSVWALD